MRLVRLLGERADSHRPAQILNDTLLEYLRASEGFGRVNPDYDSVPGYEESLSDAIAAHVRLTTEDIYAVISKESGQRRARGDSSR